MVRMTRRHLQQLGFLQGVASPSHPSTAPKEPKEPRDRSGPDQCPLESLEGEWLMNWVREQQGRHPDLALFFHVANGGARGIQTGAQLKREGVRRGVPDYVLPVQRQGYAGLFIELKRVRGSSVEPEQRAFLQALRDRGYRAEICRGHRAAIAVLCDYLDIAERLEL